jgi:mannitol 2-dehydrogenase
VWLGQNQFYGDLGQDARVADCFERWLNLIWNEGTEMALNEYLAA